MKTYLLISVNRNTFQGSMAWTLREIRLYVCYSLLTRIFLLKCISFLLVNCSLQNHVLVSLEWFYIFVNQLINGGIC